MDGNALNQIERADPLVERVLAEITDAIVTGRLRPGDQLVETRLGEQLGVSRGPVREAFRRLEQMGLIEKIPYRGAFVSTLTERDIEELHRVRGPLEGLAARLLAERLDSAVIARLDAILDQMRQAAVDADQGRMIELDAGFHDALVGLADHKLLGEVWVAVSVRLRRFLLLKRQRLYRTLQEAAPLHEPIVRAIAAGDPERAALEAQRHVAEAGQRLGHWAAPAVEVGRRR
ncbi:MAG TPA: GntR family transcriptional regulator [Chloroflexi bacterium]|nr:GntR family transcriptional regulator [Chloroflexota bacterium]